MPLLDIFTLGWETTRRALTRDYRVVSLVEAQIGSAAVDIVTDDDAESAEYWDQYYHELEVEEEERKLELEAQRAKQPDQFYSWEDADEWQADQDARKLTEQTWLDGEGWGLEICESRPLVVPKERLTWVSPLPDLSTLTEADMITASQNSEFLSRYLAEERTGGISFEQSQYISEHSWPIE